MQNMQIFVRYQLKSYTLDVELGYTLEIIKGMIEDRGIVFKLSHYDLEYYGRRLENNNKTLADYKIQKDSTINLYPKSPLRLKSTIQIKFRDEILEIYFPCFCCYSIRDYKSEIYKKRGYPVISQYLYSDEEGKDLLNDDCKESNPVLLVIDETKLSKGYKVKYFDGSEEYDIIEGLDLENIKDIKKKIEDNYKLPKGTFELIYDHNALSDKKTLSDYNIYYTSTIYLVIEKKYEKLLFRKDWLFVKYKGKSYTAGISDYTILSIKKYFLDNIIRDMVEIDKIKIIFQGKILDNNLNIKDEGLCAREMELIVTD